MKKKKLLTLLFEGDGEMMKKLLVVMLVLGMSSIALATSVGLHIAPAAPGGSANTALNASETATVYVTVDTTGLPGTVTNLGILDAVISIDGGGATGTIVQALNRADLNPAGHQWGAYTQVIPPAIYAGGWMQALSFNPILLGQSAEIGVGQLGNQVYDTTFPVGQLIPPDMVTHFLPWYNGAVGYVEIHCLGAGDITVSIANGFGFGPSGTVMSNGVTVPNFGGPVTVHQVPEPATIALLGLGGLFLRRRRKKSK